MSQFHAGYKLTCTNFAHPDITTGMHTNGPCTVWVRYKGGPWLCTHEKSMHRVRKAIDEQGEGYARELEWLSSRSQSMDDLDQLTDPAAAYEPCMSLTVEPDGKSVELMLDGSISTYGEWIKGEGADICLLRCRETNRVVGVRLPLLNEKLAVFHRGPLVVNDGFKKEPQP